MKTCTIKGADYRAQIRAIDLTGDGVPESVRSDRPLFGVWTLPVDAHPSTAFTVAGNCRYCGNDAQDAFESAQEWAGHRAAYGMPKSFLSYLKRWGLKT